MGTTKPNITVLGGFGFIGGHLVSRLVSAGYPVTVFCRASHDVFSNELGQPIRYCYGDFANPAELEKALIGANVVFHLIGNTVPQSSNENPRFDVDSHIGPTLTLLDLCVKHQVAQVVFTSSGGTVYGIPQAIPITEIHPTVPISSYGIQKITIEHYLRLYNRIHGLAATVLRIANPYGPGQNISRNQGIIGVMASKFKQGKAIDIWGDGSVVRDYIYISDLIAAMEQVILKSDGFDVYNIGTGIGTSINQIVETFHSLQLDLQVNYQTGRLVDIPINILDISKFTKTFPWQPKIKLEKGILNTLNA